MGAIIHQKLLWKKSLLANDILPCIFIREGFKYNKKKKWKFPLWGLDPPIEVEKIKFFFLKPDNFFRIAYSIFSFFWLPMA